MTVWACVCELCSRLVWQTGRMAIASQRQSSWSCKKSTSGSVRTVHVNAKFCRHEAPAYGKISRVTAFTIHETRTWISRRRFILACVCSLCCHPWHQFLILAYKSCRLLTPVLVYYISRVIVLNIVLSITVTRKADERFIGQSEVDLQFEWQCPIREF